MSRKTTLRSKNSLPIKYLHIHTYTSRGQLSGKNKPERPSTENSIDSKLMETFEQVKADITDKEFGGQRHYYSYY